MDDPKPSMNLPRLRVLWSFTRPHRGTLAVGLAMSLVSSALGLATPMVTKWVLDSLSARSSLLGPIVAMLVLLVVGLVITYRQWVLLGTLGERVVLEARESLVRRMLRATVPALARRSTGELVTRVTSDTLLLREAAATSLVGLVNGLVMLVGTLVLMGVLDLPLLGVTVAATVVVVVLFALLMPGIAKAQVRAQDTIGRLGGVLEGALRAIRTVKVSGAEDRQAEKIIDDARASAAHGVRALRREAIAWVIAWSGLQLAIIMILGLGAWRVGGGELAVSSLIAFLLYAFGLMEPIMELSQSMTTLQNGIAAAERIREIEDLEVEPAPGPAAAARPRPDGGPVLEIRNVTAAYGPGLPPAVRDVTLTVPRRGHLAIVGPSGAGKTTLLSLILRFLEPQEGELRLDGTPYRDLTHAEIRSRLAYVEQDTPIVPGTIGENVRYAAPDATDDEVAGVLRAIRLADKVDTLDEGLDTPLTSTSVSGGERQRIALARALLRTPEVLLLDEATAQLDGLTEDAIHRCVRERAATGAVVTIAHRLSTVIDADTIVLMEAGRVRAQGTHGELLERDSLYRELVEALRIANVTGTAGTTVPA
ncbi:ABC transporter ATP-binding protein [Actinomadura kijaniata]|uniref:ATP-binding cassette subfamily B protein n=1 Tax=Actinomadura namibiensis TaxID=182080 RepID=A0A7W3QL69_ACTNM|nr:ABC transporter ATP-binding protein [Actinomadura namibiensis]MBA8951205.1 ATP-binding cassette subfamily B protein [Actinomadura namibiensis]